MEHSFFHRLSRILWTAIVAAIVGLAVYASLGRLLMANVDQYRERILSELNARVPFRVEADSVSGGWHSFSPDILLSGLRLTIPGSPDQPLELAEGRMSLDVLEMLLTGSLKISHLQLDQLRLRSELTADGQFRLIGLGGGGGLEQWLESFLLNTKHMALTNIDLQLNLPDGSRQEFDLGLDLRRDGGYRELEATLVSADGARITALAEGVGNPFRPESFVGELYLNMAAIELDAVQSILPGELPVAVADGSFDLQLWLSWDEGEPQIEGQLDARDLLVSATGDDWQIPIERLAFDASLVERKNRWTLFASDLVVRKRGQELVLPRLQLRLRGDSIHLRSQEVSLAQLNRALVELELTPPGLADVFRVLQPGGELSALELSVEDYRRPASEWILRANFQQLALDSWRGAPGASGAGGYLQLGASGGFVVVDAREMSLEFPTVYRQPLRYEDLHGTVNINWYDDAVVLSSGLISARGSEGVVQALFGLNIPLRESPVGLEMDLLAGLRDAGVEHRGKYLPYILDAGLLHWLEDSIDEGTVDEGGFIWRGSLRGGLGAARTVQLFFDVSETRLDYHPRWPQIDSLDGLVLIDDTDVSIWSEHAQLYGTEVEFLSAEARMAADGKVHLDIDTVLDGAAADGLRVVRESPLNELTAGVFESWTLDGELATRLQLHLNLTDPGEAPGVQLRARPQNAVLGIEPGGLAITDINGLVAYSSDRGFSSEALTARLWGQPVALDLAQTGARYAPASSATEVNFSTWVEMADLRRWLDIPVLGLASGGAAASGRVSIPPGEAPRIIVNSDLEGVALDLPAPWAEQAAGDLPLQVALTLAAEQTRIELDLGQQVRLHLGLERGVLQGGALGFWQSPAVVEPGLLRIGGQLPVADVQQWQAFIRTWFAAELDAAAGAPPPATGSGEGDTAAAGAAAAGIRAIQLENLEVESLRLWGRELQGVVVNLEREPDRWLMSAELDWLAARLLLLDNGPGSRLQIDRLDFSGLSGLGLTGIETGGQVWNLPAIDVVARNLLRDGRPLGELAFGLRSQGKVLLVEDITGDIAGMQLWAEDANQLEWQQGADSHSALQTRLHFRDLGQTLQQFDYQKILETSDGHFELALDWPGGPQQFALNATAGSVSAEVGEGKFLNTPAGATGALRVVSILNLAEIVSRLSLTHMFESGITFRTMEGEAFLHRGTIEVARLDVHGASSGFQFSGLSAIDQKALDGQLVVTLPVANNLPWVAALAAGLPVAAGVFVVSKVFEKQFNQLSSAVYGVTGTWDDPQVSFSRIFDVTAESASDIAEARFPDAGEGAAVAAPDPENDVYLPAGESVSGSAERPAAETNGLAVDEPAAAVGVASETVEIAPERIEQGR